MTYVRRGNVRLKKNVIRGTVRRGNVRSGNCPFGELSFGKSSIEEMSSGNCCLSGKIRLESRSGVAAF